MSDIERTTATDGGNGRSMSSVEVVGELSSGRNELGRAVNHVSQFDPDLGVQDHPDVGFTWIALERRDLRPDLPANRPRPSLGWSLLIATAANLVLAAVAIASGATLVGLVACSALSVATCLLVVAEVVGRYGFDPVGRRLPPPDDWLEKDRFRS